MKPVKIIGWLLIGVGGIDLALGNTGQSPLPTFITNYLTQQTDLVLIVVGGAMVFMFK